MSKEADKYYYDNFPVTLNIGEEARYEQITNAFDAVVASVKKNKWHDLEKDPNDLPDTDRKVLVKCIRFGEKDSYVDGCYCNGSWCHDGSDVSAWKEID